MVNVKIRPAVPDDAAFVCATWKQSWWRESQWANRVTWAVFEPGHAKVIARLLKDSDVLIACDPITETEIAGYIVFNSRAVHFAYVKPAFRMAGVLRALLKSTNLPADLAGIFITHGTRAWFSAPPLKDKKTNKTLKPGRLGIEEKFPFAIHNPYLAFEEHP
jgi:hypothetical protein